MPTYIELFGPGGHQVVHLANDRVTVGRSIENEIVLSGDGGVSTLHVVLERYGPAWAVRDVGSRNGTHVNGELLLGERTLKADDEIRIGQTRLVFRNDEHSTTPTDAAKAPPPITRREHDVLIALCRPLFSEDLFTEPATVREIAAELVISETAVKQHLSNLYGKFGVEVDGERRRAGLANAAVRQGAVNLAEVRKPPSRKSSEAR